MRAALVLGLALLGVPFVANAQERHAIRFESVDAELEVFVGSRHVCRTPCEHLLPAGARVPLAFAREARGPTVRGRHANRGLDPVGFGDFDVLAPRTLRLQWVDHGDLRLAGDVVLVVGVTLGALLGGTLIASYDGDDGLFAAGIGGLLLMGLSLIVGIPLAVFDDEVHEAQ